MNAPIPLIVWGAGGHATVVADAVRLAGDYEILGFLDDLRPHRWGAPFCGATILGGAEQLAHLSELARHLILGFGLVSARMVRAEEARSAGFSFAVVVHPRATIARDVEIGPGTLVAAGAVLGPGSRLGEHVIVNTGASVDHGSRIQDHVHVSVGARLGGQVEVARGAMIGMAATVLPRVHIGAGAVIGAGSLVLEDIPPDTVARGVPARIFAAERA